MVDFKGALEAASTGLGVLKELSQITKAYDEAALKLKIAELTGTLATVQIALAEAQSEAAKKDALIAKLEGNFKEKVEMVEYKGFHYRKGGDGRPRGRAYCPRCLEKGRVFMTVKTAKAGRPDECPECKTEYQGISSFDFD